MKGEDPKTRRKLKLKLKLKLPGSESEENSFLPNLVPLPGDLALLIFDQIEPAHPPFQFAGNRGWTGRGSSCSATHVRYGFMEEREDEDDEEEVERGSLGESLQPPRDSCASDNELEPKRPISSERIPDIAQEALDETEREDAVDLRASLGQQPAYSPLHPESVSLPENWSRYFDETHQSYYYYNHATGQSQWEYPLLEEDPMVLYDDNPEPIAPFCPPQEEQDEFVDYSVPDEVNEKVFQQARKPSPGQGGTNKDYIALARAYKFQRPFSDPNFRAICLLCHRNECEDVFFPCQHRCVCRSCIIQEEICDEATTLTNPNGYCICSLCADVIKKILPFDHGREEERFWDWVYEDKVELPPSFMRTFKHSAGMIETVFVNGGQASTGTTACTTT